MKIEFKVSLTKAFKALTPVTVVFVAFVGFFVTAHFTGFLN